MYTRTFFVILLALAAAPVLAQAVKVDLSQNGDVEPGWIDWNTGGVRLNNNDASRRFLNEAGFDDDFTIDFVKIDSRNRGQMDDSIPLHDVLEDAFKESNPFDMRIRGLAAGKYVITTYHHDTNEDVVNDDGTLNITVKDADGTRLVADHLQQSWGPKPTFVGTAVFFFRSDGSSDVVMTFGDNNDGIHNEAYLNGFTIDVPVSVGSASNPRPENGQADVPRDVTLVWTPGIYAPQVQGHRVYLGDSFSDVNEGTGGVVVDANSYTPAAVLEFGKTYYWRVDEVNSPPDSTVYVGDIWQFAVEPLAYAIRNVAATASSYAQNQGPENTVNGSGLDANDLHSKQTETMWLSSTTDTGPVWIRYEFDRVYKLHEMWVWNFNGESILSGFALRNVAIDYSTNGTDYTTLGQTYEFAKATGANGYAHNTTVDFAGAAARYVRITAGSNWGGAIFNQYGLSEVRFFYIPVQARGPVPGPAAADVHPAPVLSWRAGREAVSHKVYFSGDKQAVIDGTAPAATTAQASYDAGTLQLSTSYYWRVDEVNDQATPSLWQGDIWDFTTADSLLVDDFESYDAADNQIWYAWHDGLGYGSPKAPPYFAGNGTGSAIGDETTSSFTEETIVHGGHQSMPLNYDNNKPGYARYSEVERTLTVSRDWTRHGISVLSLWFQGGSANAPEPMYIAVANSTGAPAVVYHQNAGAAQTATWTEWVIPLQLFADQGIDLTNVDRIIVGLGTRGNQTVPGGLGKMYFDDIRLYPTKK